MELWRLFWSQRGRSILNNKQVSYWSTVVWSARHGGSRSPSSAIIYIHHGSKTLINCHIFFSLHTSFHIPPHPVSLVLAGNQRQKGMEREKDKYLRISVGAAPSPAVAGGRGLSRIAAHASQTAAKVSVFGRRSKPTPSRALGDMTSSRAGSGAPDGQSGTKNPQL